MLFEVCALHLEYVFLQYLQLIQLIPIYLLTQHRSLAQPIYLKVHYEVLQRRYHVFGVDVGAVYYSDVIAG
jgi:hypothetical protein